MTDLEKARTFLQTIRKKTYEMILALDSVEQLKAMAANVEISEVGLAEISLVTEAKLEAGVTKQEVLWKTQREAVRKFLSDYSPKADEKPMEVPKNA